MSRVFEAIPEQPDEQDEAIKQPAIGTLGPNERIAHILPCTAIPTSRPDDIQ